MLENMMFITALFVYNLVRIFTLLYWGDGNYVEDRTPLIGCNARFLYKSAIDLDYAFLCKSAGSHSLNVNNL